MAELTVWLYVVGLADLVAGSDGDTLTRRMGGVATAALSALAGALLFHVRPLTSVLVAVGAMTWVLLRSTRGATTSLAALVVLGGGTLVATFMSSPLLETAPLANRIGESENPVLSLATPGITLLVLAVGVAMLSTGNAVVRAGLRLADADGVKDAEARLRGGRVIGALERLLILGFALGGEWTAAALVISAKGLLRFKDTGSEHVSEYVLVGSLLSWSTALTAAGLLALVRI